jgi:cytochrome c oxidase subunit III
LIRAQLARRFFVAAAMQLMLCAAIATVLAAVVGRPEPSHRLTLPTAFQFSTVFLAVGSWLLHRAIRLVQIERRAEFRRTLLLALSTAVLFVGIQSFGLWQFVTGVVDYRQTQLNVHGFVFMFTTLHGLHFVVAQSVLLWVTLSAFADRYDHEYYWGVTFAAWCWHVLGIVWIAILCVFAIAI